MTIRVDVMRTRREKAYGLSKEKGTRFTSSRWKKINEKGPYTTMWNIGCEHFDTNNDLLKTLVINTIEKWFFC